MFSGPDFLYVDQFFPRAAVYVLCGKEALGPPPDPLRIANLSGALGNLENAMKSSLNTTYFITKDMKVDLHEQNLNGVLPILYTCIARADKSITNVSFGSLNSGGVFEEAAPGRKGGSTPGVRIRYTDNQSGSAQTLYYFTTDISDGGIKATPGFLKFCQRLGTGASFLKSPSYLLFESGFATIRNFILDHSNMIVQDDSGIPLAYFDPNKWNLRFFGVYLGPIDMFKQHYQPRLQRTLPTNQSAAARLRIRLPMELQGSESDRRHAQVILSSRAKSRDPVANPIGNFAGSFDSAALRSG